MEKRSGQYFFENANIGILIKTLRWKYLERIPDLNVNNANLFYGRVILNYMDQS